MNVRKTSWEDLPNDCWEFIFSRLNRRNRELVPISLVNKSFLAITDRLYTTLTLRSCFLTYYLSRLNSRFPDLTSLHLFYPNSNLDGFLRELANSSLRLQTLALALQTTFPREAMRLLGGSSMRNTLTTLCFVQLQWLTDEDLFVVADCFPYLRRLALHLWSNNRFMEGFTDKGVCAISARLVSLVSLNISFNGFISQPSFTSLSSNCPGLSFIRATFGQDSPTPIDYFSSFPSLTSLDLCHVNIDEGALDQLAKANLKLWKLVLSCPQCGRGVSSAAMCRFLKSCKLLTHLELKFMRLTQDTTSSDFVASIPKVEAIHICNVTLPSTILFDMLQGCPNLKEIVLMLNFVKTVDYMLDPPVHNKLRKLLLSGDGYSDETLAVISSICPNLEFFYVDDIPEVTEQGTEAVRARCANIKICERIHDHGLVNEDIYNLSYNRSMDVEAFSSAKFAMGPEERIFSGFCYLES